MAWRLGIDLGTNSLGWWAFSLVKEGQRWRVKDSLDGGVYVFPDGREPARKGRVGDSKAVERRQNRAMRRNRDRRRTRMKAFARELSALGLLPEDKERRSKLFQTASKAKDDPDRYNPYRLRAEALERPLCPEELGRALFHLGLRRGFKSNRIEQSEEDGGSLRAGISSLAEALDGRTLGQFLWDRYQEQKTAGYSREKPRGIRFRGFDGFYPERSMYAQEFEAIQMCQSRHHQLTPADWDRLKNRFVLFQWPLKPVERGTCEFCPKEPRHWKDTPIGHDFRIHQELNALRWLDTDLGAHPLNMAQRQAVLDTLMTQTTEVKFSSLRKKKDSDGELLFPDCRRFNLEQEKRKGLKPHTIAARFRKDPVLADLWKERESEKGDNGRLDNIFEVLFESADDSAARQSLAMDFDLDEKAVKELLSLKPGRATASVSRKFMQYIVPVLKNQGLIYSDAVAQILDEQGIPLHHSDRRTEARYDRLPYYGEILKGSMLGAKPEADPVASPEAHFGKINNPTVHVALNALRNVLNELIDRYGESPTQVHVELGRELKNPKSKTEEINARQERETRANEKIRAELQGHGIKNPSALDLKKFKLWEELGKEDFARRCPFSGKPISLAQLFNGEAEIEHILPFKRTLDNSIANLTVAMRWANRLKGNRSPYEAFGSNAYKKDGIEWETVRERGASLPANKVWRFGPDAMKKFEDESEFIARQLTDNAYIARAAASYLRCLRGVEDVVPNRGGLTALLRGKWRFNGILSDDNRKSREDHRHHAVDAAVIGLTDRSLLSGISRQSARGTDDRMHIELAPLDSKLEESIRQRVPEIVTAYKPDHGWQGPIYRDTAYGFVHPEKRDPELPNHNLVARKAVTELTPKEEGAIRDPHLRQKLRSSLEKGMETGEKREKTLAHFGEENSVRRVRILVSDQTVTPLSSAPYKGYKAPAYVCCDVWRIPKGKAGKWTKGEYIWKGKYWSYADAGERIPNPADGKPHPAARHVARLFKNDLVSVTRDGRPEILRVAGFSTTNNKLDVVPHNLTDPGQTHVSINKLGQQGLRKLHVAPDGRVRGIPSGKSG